MHHDLSAKYVDACPVQIERLATPQMTERRLGCWISKNKWGYWEEELSTSAMLLPRPI